MGTGTRTLGGMVVVVSANNADMVSKSKGFVAVELVLVIIDVDIVVKMVVVDVDDGPFVIAC